MLTPEGQQQYARDAIREFLADVECVNAEEMIVALEVVITRCVNLIARKTDSDTAQCALYKPYKALLDKDNNNAV